jgi:hypothetical protein
MIDRSDGAFVLSINQLPPQTEEPNGEPEASPTPRPRRCGIIPCL